jgi:hypothetical protein
LDEALAMCRRLWSTFDLPQMTIGSLLCVGGVVVAAMLAALVQLQAANEVPLLSVAAVGESMLLTNWALDALFGLVLGVVLLLLFSTTVDWRVLVGVVGLLVLVGTIARLLVTTAWARVQWRAALLPSAWLVLLLCALRGAGQFSNSFIEADVDVLAFFATTLALALVAHGVRRRVKRGGAGRRRAVRGDCACDARWRDALLQARRECDRRRRVARRGALARADCRAGAARCAAVCASAVGVVVVCASACCVEPRHATDVAHRRTGGAHRARAAGAAAGARNAAADQHCAAVVVASACVCAAAAVREQRCCGGGAGARRGRCRHERSAPTERLMRVLATSLLLLANLYLLLLGPLTAYVVVLALIVAPLLLRIVLDARGVDDYASAALSLCLFGNLLFFATGHAYSFAEVHVAAAFVGFEEVRWASAFVLVLVNTFGSHIAPLLALPLVLTRVARRADLMYEQLQGALLSVHAFYAIQSCLTTCCLCIASDDI